MDYHALKNFLENDMTMQEVYQPAMIRLLLKNNFAARQPEIVGEMARLSQKDPETTVKDAYYDACGVLMRHSVAVTEESPEGVHGTLKLLLFPAPTDDEVLELIQVCDYKIVEQLAKGADHHIVTIGKLGGKNFDKNVYVHKNWRNRKQDEPHGNIKEGDLILFYFGSLAQTKDKWKKIMKIVCRVSSVSSDGTEIKFDKIAGIRGITLEEIKAMKKAMNKKKMKYSFKNLPHEGINVINLAQKELQFFINADRHMHRNVWLCSIKSADSHKHFEDTVLSEQVTASIRIGSDAKRFPSLCVWGMKEFVEDPTTGRKKRAESYARAFKAMKMDDIILFCSQNGYTHTAVIEGKEKNEDLAKDLWGVDTDNNTWTLVFWMRPESLIAQPEVSIAKFNDLIGYQTDFPGPLNNSPMMKISLERLLEALILK